MKSIMVLTISILVLMSSPGFCQGDDVLKTKTIENCLIDIDADGDSDMVFFEKDEKNGRLFLVRKDKSNYQVLLVGIYESFTQFTCNKGKYLMVISDIKDSGKKSRIKIGPGAFIKRSQPEGANSALYWKGGFLTEVWISD